MAQIGRLGNVNFTVSSKKVQTFDDMQWKISPKISIHDRLQGVELLEYTGSSAEEISFNMNLSALLGSEVNNELRKLKQAARIGKRMQLVIGKKKIGRHKWIIQSLSVGLKQFSKKGRLIKATVAITLKESC